MKTLPYDFHRCKGESENKVCERRSQCIRFTQLKITAPWTAYSDRACGQDKSFPSFIQDDNENEQH